MTEEFNLSEKIRDAEFNNMHFDFVNVEDVKTFIKESNEDLDMVRTGKMSISKFIRRFKQRAGDELVK